MKQRAIITGGAGFIGSHIVDRLVDMDYEVLVIDNLSTGKLENVHKSAKLAQLDICEPEIQDLIVSFEPDLVIHCAAQSAVTHSVSDPGFDARVNIIGGINVCDAVNKSVCKQVVYITTGGALYGKPEYLPCDETHPISPISPYGLSKWTLERYQQLILRNSIRIKTLRLSNVYGSRQDSEGEAGVIAIFTQRMMNLQTVNIYGNGSQTRDFVYVDDVVDSFELAVNFKDSITVNVGSGISTSINELFELVSKVTGYVEPAEYLEPRPNEIEHMNLDCKRAKNYLQWVPKTNLAEGIKKTAAFLKKETFNDI